uniref:probable zinc transporter protein DDB_G0291141 n=1 Tax=Fragaria vesca subsp. vesca TaxID=101020 RepID=UPI0005C9E2AF|nr:PREDICTED: probable zinc transporter protein DDB_G0291141 [Fragaria vesca subsp. vesca]
MADHHHHHHRPHRLSLPQRPTTPTTFASTTPTTSRQYPLYPFTPSSATPSKHRLSSLNPKPLSSSAASKSSLSFLFLLLLSLRSLYSLLPFLRSSPSFSLFPFSFLVSLLSFLLTLAFSLFTSSSAASKDPFHNKPSNNQPIFSLTHITQSQHRLLVLKSILLAGVFLLRFQALRYCGAAAMILAEMSGNVAARFLAEGSKQSNGGGDRNRSSSKVRGFLALVTGLFLLSMSWDRIECFPFSAPKLGVKNCVRFWPMLLPFLCGFLGCYERVSMNWGSIRQLGRKRVRVISLFFTTVVLFIPAVVSVFVYEAEGDGVSIGNLGWPLANTVVFGVLLSEGYSDEKSVSSKDFRREYLVTFLCTVVLELFYFAELSLWGLLLCGMLLYIAVRELDPFDTSYLELGMESSESFSASVMKPVRHILSERKSRKIALFLLINTAYMFVEFIAGFLSNSLGLISDACHMLFDCAALAIGLYASYISRLPANNQFNYGCGRFEVLAGYTNAVFLVLVGALIVLESLERILDPQEMSTSSLLVVSIGGLLVNVVGLIFFHEEHHHAHGGSGSCSHSQNHQHSQKSVAHNHEGHEKLEECIAISQECAEESCDSDHQHGNSVGCKDHLHDHHNHSHQHDHHDHSHQHDHHDHSHQHDHHDHSHQHNHHDHSHQHDHHDHSHQHDHHAQNHKNDHHGHGHHGQSHQHGGSELNILPEKSIKHQHHHIDHNMEGIFLHVLADTLGSVGVVISTLLIRYKGWLVADPACSIFISVLIISSVIPLLRNSAEVLLQRIPRAHEQDLRKALNDVRKIRGVSGIQNLHVWSFTNSDVVGTLHLHVSTEIDKGSAKAQVSHLLHDAGIKDLTVQLECVE